MNENVMQVENREIANLLNFIKQAVSMVENLIDTETSNLEKVADLNTVYHSWIETANVTRSEVVEFPTVEMYNAYLQYCIANKYPFMTKKQFFRALEFDFGLSDFAREQLA